MTECRVKVLHNTNRFAMLHGYGLDDMLELVDEYNVTTDLSGPAVYARVAEIVFREHNAVDGSERNVKLKLRSLSVGDVLEITPADGPTRAYACAPLGWKELESGATGVKRWDSV